MATQLVLERSRLQSLPSDCQRHPDLAAAAAAGQPTIRLHLESQTKGPSLAQAAACFAAASSDGRHVLRRHRCALHLCYLRPGRAPQPLL